MVRLNQFHRPSDLGLGISDNVPFIQYTVIEDDILQLFYVVSQDVVGGY